MDDDFKRGYASAPRSVFTGTPDDYQSHFLHPGDPIPEGAKSRPWFLGQDKGPVEAPEKPKPKRRTTKKKSSSSSGQGRVSGDSTTGESSDSTP